MSQGTVLVATQDERLQDALAKGLETAGYCVFTAADGLQAFNWITTLKNCSRPIELLVIGTRLDRLPESGLIEKIEEMGIDTAVHAASSDDG